MRHLGSVTTLDTLEIAGKLGRDPRTVERWVEKLKSGEACGSRGMVLTAIVRELRARDFDIPLDAEERIAAAQNRPVERLRDLARRAVERDPERAELLVKRSAEQIWRFANRKPIASGDIISALAAASAELEDWLTTSTTTDPGPAPAIEAAHAEGT